MRNIHRKFTLKRARHKYNQKKIQNFPTLYPKPYRGLSWPQHEGTYFSLHRKPFLFPGNKNRALTSLLQSQSSMGSKNNGQKRRPPRNLFSSCRGETQGMKTVPTTKQIHSAHRQPLCWDSLLVTIEIRSQLISDRELHALAKSKPIPLSSALSKSPTDNSRADQELVMRTQ